MKKLLVLIALLLVSTPALADRSPLNISALTGGYITVVPGDSVTVTSGNDFNIDVPDNIQFDFGAETIFMSEGANSMYTSSGVDLGASANPWGTIYSNGNLIGTNANGIYLYHNTSTSGTGIGGGSSVSAAGGGNVVLFGNSHATNAVKGQIQITTGSYSSADVVFSAQDKIDFNDQDGGTVFQIDADSATASGLQLLMIQPDGTYASCGPDNGTGFVCTNL